MTQEFNSKSVIAQAEAILKDDKKLDQPIPIVLSLENTATIGLFLTTFNYERKKKAARQGNYAYLQLKGDILYSLEDRFEKAIGDGFDPKFYLDITRREIDQIGEALIEESQGSTPLGKQLNTMRQPAYQAYLILEGEYIKSGGLENNKLSQKVKNLLKEPKRKK